MGIIRIQKNKDYTTISNDGVHDKSLSWAAKGLLLYLISLPDNWKVKVEHLKTVSKTGRDGTNSAMKELIAAGYIQKGESIKHEGKFSGYDYTVTEKPLRKNRYGKTVTEKPELISTKEISTKEISTNKNILKKEYKLTKKSEDSSLFNSFIPIEKNIYSLLVKTLPIAFRNRLPAAGVKPTALLYQTESLILAIREGRFFRDVTIPEQKQEDWVAGIRIVRSLKGSSWEDIGKVLKRAAKRYQMMLSPKYGFPNKKGMTRDINIFLYNPNSQHSWFLECLSHKPKQNSQYINDHNIKQFQSDIPTEALSALTKFKRNNWDEGGYWKKSRDLYEWYDDERKRLKEANPNWSSYCGRFERFLKYYDEFTESWDIFTLGHFGAENKTWDRFVEWLNTEYGVNLNPRRQRTQSVSTTPRKAMKEKTEREVIAARLVSEGICDDIDEAMPFADIEVIRKESENGENRTYAGI